MTNNKLNSLIFNGMVCAIGVLVFLVVVGPNVLQPTNIGWLMEGDPAQHYLGWHFFKTSEWSFPIGLNPKYGLEISNAIIFSDSNPLFAFIFKLFSDYLPNVFQYFGIWLLLCFILHAWFASKLIALISHNKLVILIGTCLFCFAPPMMLRIHGHLSLVGHFLILASLYLTFSTHTQKKIYQWMLLLVLCSLIHAYFLVMIGLIWSASIIDNFLKKKITLEQGIVQIAITLVLVSFTCWQAGYFSVGRGVSSQGYGDYKMNLLSLIHPYGWSYLLPDIKIPSHQSFEGYNYLGLGFLFLGGCSLPALFANRAKMINVILLRPVFLFVVLFFIIFSVTNNIGVGSLNFYIPIPDIMLKIANIFRASGRFFWPVFYLILYSIVLLVIKGYGQRSVILLLAFALLLQSLDLSKGWGHIRERYMVPELSEWPTKMQDPFWVEAASKYKSIRLLPPAPHHKNWQSIASYASSYNLSTNAVYLARFSSSALESARRNAKNQIQHGEYNSDSIYIVAPDQLKKVASTINSSSDLLAKIDNMFVIAPGWQTCSSCPSIRGLDYEEVIPEVHVGDKILFDNKSPNSMYLMEGWSQQEEWGRWSDGDEAEIIIPVMSSNFSKIILEVQPFLINSNQSQAVLINLNGVDLGSQILKEGSGALIIEIPKSLREARFNRNIFRLRLMFPDAVIPTELGDPRKLALGIKALTLK